MESFDLELFPECNQVHIALFENVTNASELKKKLLDQDSSLSCALVDAAFVISPFHALLATQRAVHEKNTNKLKTHNFYSQIIFDFSPNSNIAKSFQQFGLKDATKNVVAIKLGGSADEAESIMKSCIQGDLSNLRCLPQITDLNAIKKAYQIQENEQNLSTITNLVASAIALKGH